MRDARDAEWIDIESSHQQGLSLGVGEARLLQAAVGVPRHRQVSLTQTRAPRCHSVTRRDRLLPHEFS